MPDNVLCSVVVIEVPMCWTVLKLTPYFPVTVVVFFLWTHCNTRALSVGAPEDEITGTRHATFRPLHNPRFYFIFLNFLLEVTCRAAFQTRNDARWCNIHHSSVGLQKKHSICQNRVYTFLFSFRLGDVFGFIWVGREINHSTPQIGVPQDLHTWWRWRVVNSGAFLCMNVDAKCTIVTIRPFQFGCLFFLFFSQNAQK